ncbi:hypothetical protein [Phaeovulum sp.]|uniref:hypothetical protein n=1 Tax=Phaeovulum sp. TaxID=2934796 RepID=UPI0039E2B211
MTRKHVRIGMALLFALVLAATSLTMAVARGQTRVAGEIVICTGYGLTTALVDENGAPTGPIHICPDMVLALMSAVSIAPALPAPPDTRAQSLDRSETFTPASRTLPSPRARDPPLSV